MAQISITVNGRAYLITCDDGQESQLKNLGAYLDGRVQELTASVGQVGESRLLLMAGLLIADELFEAKNQVKGGGKAAAGASDAAAATKSLEACVQRIENIAAQLQAS